MNARSVMTLRRLGLELAVSTVVWAMLWLPGVHQALVVTRNVGRRPAPTLAYHVAVRYAIFAVLSVALFEYVIRFPFRKGNRFRALVAYTVGFPLFSVAYAVIRVLTLRYIHGLPMPAFRDAFLHQISGQMSTLFMEQLWWYLSVVVIAHAAMYQRAARQREVQEAELRAELARQQLQILKLQLHPHFLFNVLHGISSLMDTDIERARTAMAHFSDLLRIALSRTATDEIALRDEIAFIESYLALEKLRLGDRLEVSIDVPEALRDAKVPTMVLQPLVENAIRHGIEKRRGQGRVDIRIFEEDNRIRMRVTNDAGREESPGSGIGLRNTRGRLNALYGAAHDFSAMLLPDDRFQVTLTMPLRT